MRFLVTGGAGFIGSHIVERLLKEGHFVRVLDNFSSGKRENLSFTQKGLSPCPAVGGAEGTVPKVKTKGTVPDFELIEGDIRDKATCDKACQGIDYVLHQAALRSVPRSMKDPASYNDVNINGTLFMLQAAAKNKIKRFVFASSSSVYGDIDKFPEREDFLPQPISPYALTKLAGEYYCRIFSEHFNLETVALRYFNVFGPRQALDDEYAVVIPKFIHCILHDEQPPILGTGKQSRDFTYIDNVVEANILAATKGLSPFVSLEGLKGTVPVSKHEVFNVANGQDNTVLQLVDCLNMIIGKNIKPKFLPVRPGDVFRTCADTSKIKKILRYEPKIGFEEGLKRTVAGLAIILFSLFCLGPLGSDSFAQALPIGQIERTQELLEKEKAFRGRIEREEKVFIKKIIVEGVTLLNEGQIKELILPFQKRWLSKDEIQQILDALTAAYRQNGYKEQPAKISFEIKKGFLKIKVDELTH